MNFHFKKTHTMETIIKPPLGLIPKKHYYRNQKIERFNEVCEAIKRYWDAGLQINTEWIEEYNELIEEIKILNQI